MLRRFRVSDSHNPPYTLFATFAIILIAVNLRPCIAAIGPMLDLIRRDSHLSSTSVSLLTTLPFFMIGLFALLGRPVRLYFGNMAGIAIGGLLISLACFFRFFWWNASGLIISAIGAGIGISMVQALMPGIIKRDFGTKAGLIMVFYTTSIMSGEAFGAVTVPFLLSVFSWQTILGFWSLPVLVAVIVWVVTVKKRRSVDSAGAKGAFVASSRESCRESSSRFLSYKFSRILRAWELMAFFGIGTGAFTLVLTWLPPFFLQLGIDRVVVGELQGVVTVMEVVTGLIVSSFIQRFPDRRPLLLATLFIMIMGLLCLATYPLSFVIPAVLCLGMAIGALFPLSLIIAVDHLDNPLHAGELAAFVQGGGYIIASMTPLIAGWFQDQFANLSLAWIFMIGCMIVLILMAFRFSPASYYISMHERG